MQKVIYASEGWRWEVRDHGEWCPPEAGLVTEQHLWLLVAVGPWAGTCTCSFQISDLSVSSP